MPRGPRCECGCGQGPHTSTRLRKAECTTCGYIVRLSRSCIARGLPTCPCGSIMECPCIHDCEHAGADAVYAHPIMQAELRRLQAPQRRAGDQLHCGGCNAFITAANQLCGCGFKNDFKRKGAGGNPGGWSESTYTAGFGGKDPMPF